VIVASLCRDRSAKIVPPRTPGQAGQVGRPASKNLEALLIAALIYLIANTLVSVSFRVHKFARAG